MAHSPRLSDQGQPSPSLSQLLDSIPQTHGAKPTSPSLQEGPNPQNKLPNSYITESRFTPIGTANAGPHVTRSSQTSVLPSPTPSGEASSPPAMPGQPSPAELDETPATEATSIAIRTARSFPGAPAAPSAHVASPAEARPGTPITRPGSVHANRQAGASQARCELWLAELESYISHRAGNLQPLESSRLQRLKAVLTEGDEFCVVLHGFVVLWVVDARRCAELLGLSQTVADSACQALESILGGTRAMGNDLLVSMANFPPGLTSGDLPSSSVADASKFLQRLSASKSLLREHLLRRQIPLRHRELVGVLRLRSQHLRLTFFRWSLRSLDVHNIPGNANILAALENQFAEDHDFYLDPSHSDQEYALHDAHVELVFKALMTAAKRGQPEVPPHGGSVTQPPLQDQQLRSPQQQPRDQPQEQPRKRRRTESVEERQPLSEKLQNLQRIRQQQQLQQQEHFQRLQQQQQQQQQQHPHPQLQGHPQQLGYPQLQGHFPQQQGYPQQQGHLPQEGLTDLQRFVLGQTPEQQQNLLFGRAQHYNQNLRHLQSHSPAHQQGLPRQFYPTQPGTLPSSPADMLPSPVGGQMRMPQAAGAMPGNGRQPWVQGQTPVTLSMSPGDALRQGAHTPPQMFHHGQGMPQPRPNTITPTVASQASRHPSVNQQPRTRASPTVSHRHTLHRPGSAVPAQPSPSQHQQGYHPSVRLAPPDTQNTMVAQNVGRGSAPTQDTPNPPPPEQPRVAPEPFYQYIGSLLSGPTRLPTNAKRVRFEFDISDADLKRFPQMSAGVDGKLSSCSIFDGCRRVRFRICTRPVPEPVEDLTFPENEWVEAPTVWPGSVTVKVNEDGYVTVPRGRGPRGDLPCEIVPMLRAGRNSVSVAVVSEAPPGHAFFGAIEVIDTSTRKSVIDNVLQERSLPEAETMDLIKARLAAGGDDDDIQVVDPEMYINVADPISRALVELPCRGYTCRHLDVFDLRALLESRRPKRCPHGGARATCPTCLANPAVWPDVAPINGWTCPICSGDVRPGHIVVDNFLKGVVGNLREEGTKGQGSPTAVYVDGEGRWRAKALGEKKWEGEVVVIDG